MPICKEGIVPRRRTARPCISAVLFLHFPRDSPLSALISDFIIHFHWRGVQEGNFHKIQDGFAGAAKVFLVAFHKLEAADKKSLHTHKHL